MEKPESQTVPAQPAQTSCRRRLLRLGLILVCSYVGVCLVLMFLENWMVYHPTKASQDWEPAPAADVQDVFLITADGTRIHAWWWPVPAATGAILYCHGNAGNLSHRGGSVHKLRQFLGESVLIFDYPGYGKSEGKPSEAGCYAAADAAYDWLVKEQHVDPERILIYGGSLGGGVAIDLAHRKQAYRGLALAKTFCSLPDVGQSLYPWLPVRWLMRNKFDNLGKIGQLTKPIFIGHGTRDGLIPYTQSERLFAAANEPKELFITSCDHNDPLPPEYFTRLRSFLERCESQAR